jgi:hypothetical protein
VQTREGDNFADGAFYTFNGPDIKLIILTFIEKLCTLTILLAKI